MTPASALRPPANLAGFPTRPSPPLPPSSRFVSTSGSDSGACLAAAPCRTFNRAYHVATPGEVIEAAAGSYPGQFLTADPTKTGKPFVIIRSAPGAAVSTSYLDFTDVDSLEVRDMSTSGWYIRRGSNAVTLRNVRSLGAGTFITSATNVSILDSEIANADSIDGLQVKSTGSSDMPTDILLDGVYIHDVTRSGNPDAHSECIQFTAGIRVAIRNSRFVNCSTQGVFLKEDAGGVIDAVLVENSWFGKISGINTLIFDDGVSNMIARYNSFAQAPRLGGGVGTSNIQAYGNVGVLAGCGQGVAYRNNVWSGVKCGGSDLVASPGFVNLNGFDLRLTSTSPAINRGDPANYPPADIFGTARPLGGAPDAGAVELR